MLKPTRSFIGLTWLAVLLLAPAAGRACNVPVFRYALERWAADAYELVVFHREPLTTNQQALVASLLVANGQWLAGLAITLLLLCAVLSFFGIRWLSRRSLALRMEYRAEREPKIVKTQE